MALFLHLTPALNSIGALISHPAFGFSKSTLGHHDLPGDKNLNQGWGTGREQAVLGCRWAGGRREPGAWCGTCGMRVRGPASAQSGSDP